MSKEIPRSLCMSNTVRRKLLVSESACNCDASVLPSKAVIDFVVELLVGTFSNRWQDDFRIALGNAEGGVGKNLRVSVFFCVVSRNVE